MKTFTIIVFFFTTIISLPAFALNVAIVNINYLIDNNKIYLKILQDLEINQKEYLDTFKIKENDLNILLKEIDDSKLLLNEDQLNSKIVSYNNELNKFTILIDEYNLYYQNEIMKMRENVLSNIIIILENYANKNKLDLILDSTSYLIASNSLDITDEINDELNKINFKLEYKNFEKN